MILKLKDNDGEKDASGVWRAACDNGPVELSYDSSWIYQERKPSWKVMGKVSMYNK